MSSRIDEIRHCLNPIAQQLTECGLPSVFVVIDEVRTTCEECRDRSIERGVDSYFRRHGLDRKYEVKGATREQQQ